MTSIFSLRDLCKNLCKKKSNFVSILMIASLFLLAHIVLLSFHKIEKIDYYNDTINYSAFSGFANKLENRTNEWQKQEREEEAGKNETFCNEDCMKNLIDNFLFSEDYTEDPLEEEEEEEDEVSSTVPSFAQKGKVKKGKGDKRKNKKKVNNRKLKHNHQNSLEKQDDYDDDQESHEAILPTRKRGKNQLLYKEDLAANLNSSWTQEMADKRREVFKARAENVIRACQNLGKRGGFFNVKSSKLQDNLRWVNSHHFVWCPIFKSASTTWVKNLLLLAGEKKLTKSLHGRVRELYSKPEDPQERKRVLQEFMKIIIVRHPLDRLLSAYRDKMLRLRNVKDPYVLIQQEIVKGYKDPTGLEPTSSTGTFDGSGLNQTFLHPTFAQFLLKVKDDMERFWKKSGHSQVNLHWRPYWITCGPCQLKYNVIAQVETLDPDQEYIIRELGLENILYNAHTHASNFDNYNGTSEATQHYFGQVPVGLLKEIIKLYKPDFELFGYSPQVYIDIASKSVMSKKKNT